MGSKKTRSTESQESAKRQPKEIKLSYPGGDLPHGDSVLKRALLLDDSSLASAEASFSLWRNKLPRKSNQLVLTGEAARIEYQAANFGEHSVQTRPYRYIAALINTETGEATLHDTDLLIAQRTIRLQQQQQPRQQSQGENSSADCPTNVEEATAAASHYAKSRVLLGESFGTRKTKQILSSYQKNQINVDQLASQSAFIQQAVSSGVQRVNAEVEKDSKEIAARSSTCPDTLVADPSNADRLCRTDNLLPPHDKSTNVLADIYPIDQLIPHEAYSSLDVEPLLKAFRSGNTAALAKLASEYVMHEVVESRVRSLFGEPKDLQQTEHLLRCLIYLNYLIQFRSLNETKLNSPEGLAAHLPWSSQGLCSALLQRFAERMTVNDAGQQRDRFKISNLCRDRLIVHMIIILLALDGFRLNVAQLSVLLRVGMAKSVEYCRAVGCLIERPAAGEPMIYRTSDSKREVPVKMAALKAPLHIIPVKTRTTTKSR